MISIELPEVNKMHLEGLPNIRSFSSGDIVEWSSLENVVVNHCPNLKKFEQTDNKSKQILQDEFSTIIEYYIRDNEKLGKTIDNLKPSHFTNLLLFQEKNCNETLIKFLDQGSLKLSALSSAKHYNICLTFLTIPLKGVKMGMLTHIWNKDIIRLFGFENLQIIDIKNCSSKLCQIKESKLEACVKLDEVVDHGQDDKSTIVKFPTLSKVEFKSLSKLIHFYLHHLEFSSLKTLMIEKCPQLEKFIIGFVTADASSIIDEKCFSELNELKLDSCDKLVCVISSKTLQDLRNLKKLIVTHCKSLEMVFNIHDKIFHSTELL
ncbi:hypothetical protein CR513_22939, partial [Mucuna pruriens]